MNPPIKYQRAIGTLREQLLADLKGRIHSIVLFGSVARGEARPDSDIDFLIIINEDSATKRRIDDISYNISLEDDVVIQPVFFTT